MAISVILSLLVFQALLIFVHLAVYAAIASAFGIGGYPLEIAFIILALTFTSASFISHFYKSTIVDWYYAFSAYWFGLVHFLFIGVLAFFITTNILYRSNVYVSPALLAGIFLAIAFLIHLYGTWKSGWAEITKIKVSLSGLPESWHGRKIAMMSDVHLGNIRQEKFTAKVVKKIGAFNPHVVFIVGDLYDGVACDEEKLIEPLRSLHAPGGVYFVTGNHEFYLPNVEHALAAIREIGIRIVNDEKIDVDGVDIVGVDFRTTEKKDAFENVLHTIGVNRNKTSILLKHVPVDLEIAERAGISLGFFGHTHQGQIFPLSLITRQIFHGFDYGLKPHEMMQVYTSSGAGTWGPPLRLGTKSEIVLVTFAK